MNEEEGSVSGIVSLSICICTMDRPEVLDRCLRSIADGSSIPDAVLVSDDSRNPDTTRAVCSTYPWVRYLQGPRRGLCANRNSVISHAKSEYLSLLDDDALVGATFVEQLRALLPTLDGRTIVTGDIMEHGHRLAPKNPSFWGHFTVEANGNPKTINLNCNCLPRQAFAESQFDEAIVYGYEDMDLCSSLLARSYRIYYDGSLLNEHAPPRLSELLNRERKQLSQQARFQTSMKRYLVWERNFTKAAMYFILAPLHRSLHAVKTGNWRDVPQSASDIALASAGARRQCRLAELNRSKSFIPGYALTPIAVIHSSY